MEKKTTKSKLDELKMLLDNDDNTDLPIQSNFKIEKTRQKTQNKLETLNDKHFIFIEAYMSNGCVGLDAAITAGYSVKSAKVTASHLLADPLIQVEIQKRKTQIAKDFNIDREYIMNQYISIIQSSVVEGNDGVGFIKDRNSWLKAVNALAKMIGEDGTAKIDITSQGNPINIQYIIPNTKTEEDEETEDNE